MSEIEDFGIQASPFAEGGIHLIIGPMFAGKTRKLLHILEMSILRDLKCVVITYQDDDRYGTVCTHAGQAISNKKQTAESLPIQVLTGKTLQEIEIPADVQAIAIDEGQFFPDLPEVCNNWANTGYKVIIAALNGNFRQQVFGRIGDLIPYCETITKRHAICMQCRKRPASFTIRTSPELEEMVIGAQDKYRAVCRLCRH